MLLLELVVAAVSADVDVVVVRAGLGVGVGLGLDVDGVVTRVVNAAEVAVANKKRNRKRVFGIR